MNYVLSTGAVGGIGFTDRSGISGCSFLTIVGVSCSSSTFNNKKTFVKINNNQILTGLIGSSCCSITGDSGF